MKTLLAILTLSILGCHPNPCLCGDAPSVLPEIPEATMKSDCSSACSNLRSMKCPSAEPTPKGTTCEDTCLSIQKSRVLRIDTRCLATAKTCQASEECTTN